MQGRWTLLMTLAGLLVAGTGSANAEGWKMPSLNPFSRKDSHPAHLRTADDNERPWWKPQLPTVPTLSSGKAKAKSSGSSTWTKINRGTKSAWAKTTDALNPFDDAPQKPRNITGYGSPFSQASARTTDEKKSAWWPSWGADKPKKPETVQDFLGLDRPR